MNNLNYYKQIVDQIKNIKGDKDKIQFLSQYKNNDDIKRFFIYVYNSFYVYGVTSKNLKKNPSLLELDFFDDIFQLLDLLKDRKITGNTAIGKVNHFIDIQDTNELKEFCYNIFDRNLKINMNVKSINKALGNCIPTFDVALANTYDPEKHNKIINNTRYVTMQKLNGLRLITIITNDQQGNIEIKNYSRTGKEYTSCKKINEEILTLYKNSKYNDKNLVLDGEACVIDPRGKEDWNRAISEYRTMNHTVVNPRYYIFDFLTLDQFSGLSESENYSNRVKKLNNNFLNQQTKYCFNVPIIKWTTENVEKIKQAFMDTEKWEGQIFRCDCPYKPGRSNDLLKYKLWQDMEFIVENVDISKKPMLVDKNDNALFKWQWDLNPDQKDHDWITKDVDCVGSLIVNFQGNQLNIGSGLTDQQRIEWFKNENLIINKQIVVKYKELTKNQRGTNSLSFATLYAVLEGERDF